MKWRAVVGFEHCYEVSDAGGVRSKDRIDTKGARWKQKERRGVPGNKAGHLKVMLVWGGKYYSRWIHRLVLEAFHGPAPFKGAECRHLNGKPTDNRANNLAWGSRKQNCADMLAHGTHLTGWGKHTAKFGPSDRGRALELRAAGASYSAIGRTIGCSIGKAWGLVNAPKEFQLRS